jgi:uncharacterized protein (DUF302 family)
MIEQFTIQHYEHVSTRPFAEVVASFETALGSVEGGMFRAEIESAKSPADFEKTTRSHEGSSGFMRFLTVDHGAWLKHIGLNAKAKMYTIGNPLIAATMIKFDLEAGLNVPIRLLIYEHTGTGTVRLAYDLPSSLMSRLHNKDVFTAAKILDMKLIALAELATGAAA